MKKIRYDDIKKFMYEILLKQNCDKHTAMYVSQGLADTSLRGVDSHGIRLFPHYVHAIKNSRINGNPNYTYDKNYSSSFILDADHTFGHAAGAVAMLKAVETAQNTGIAAIAVKNSSHFGAAACYSLLAAEKNCIGISFTNATSLMRSSNGIRSYFGANPLCFAAPIEGEDPLCLDMATTKITWNKVKLSIEQGDVLPTNCASDENGKLTIDPLLAKYLEPIGGYKGYGLSIIIDILCSMLTSMPSGKYISDMYGDPINEKRFLGHFFIAINIAAFENINVFKSRMKKMVNEARQEPVEKNSQSVMVPGDPEKIELKERLRHGIPINDNLIDKLSGLAASHSVDINFFN